MRTPLLENQIIKLTLLADTSQLRTFRIVKMIGKGASCIAYKAIDISSGLFAIIKECFPHNAAIRDEGGMILWNTSDDEKRARECFTKSFDMQCKIQSAETTMNTAAHLIDGLRTGNNTLYSVSDIQAAETYDLVQDNSLQEIYITARSIARAVGKYHAIGILHLDIKPENILILTGETRESIKLLDFDSLIYKSDVKNVEFTISYTQKYAAPELLQGKRNKVCEATDIYAIGAVIFSRIFGRTPTADDRGTFSDWDFSDNPLFKRLSNKTLRLTKELFKKTLSASINTRYKSTVELIAALDELIEESNPKRRYLKSTCQISSYRFSGRNKELYDIHSAFLSGKRAVFLHGMGGIGKTEIALQYAKLHDADYNVIAFGEYSNSLDDMFKDSGFISIANNSEGESNINSISELVDENSLLIIDNFDTKVDSNLKKVLSLNCKLLFTSRHSFEDIYSDNSSVAHIRIGTLSHDEQLAVFEYECGRKLVNDEIDTVKDILRDIDGYTLLIRLIAKAYKKDDFSLGEIQKRIHDTGVEGAPDIKVHYFKDSDVPRSTYEILCKVLDITIFNEDDKYVMRSLSLLGSIKIESKEFNIWLGGKYKNAINNLIERSWIQSQGVGEKTRLSLHKVIGELARNELKPDFENCRWAKNLCEHIIKRFKNEQEFLEKYGGECLNGQLLIDDEDVEYTRAYNKIMMKFMQSKMTICLLTDIFCNLNYEREDNITYSINSIIELFNGNENIVIYNPDGFSALLNTIISYLETNEAGAILRFKAYYLMSVILLIKLRWLPIDRTSTNEHTNVILQDITDEIIKHMSKAENALSCLPIGEKSKYMLMLTSPIIEMVRKKGIIAIGWCHSDNESVFKLGRYIMSLTERTPVTREQIEAFDTKVCEFDDEFSNVNIHRRFVELVSVTAPIDEIIEQEDYDNEYFELEEEYRQRFMECVSYDDIDEVLLLMSVDQRLSEKMIIEMLTNEIADLGFEPRFMWDDSEIISELSQKCSLRKNQKIAKKYHDYMAAFTDFDDRDGFCYSAQAVLLACCMGNTSRINSYINNIHNYGCAQYLVQNYKEPNGLLKALQVLGFSGIATRIINTALDRIEVEIANTGERAIGVHDIFGRAATLAEYAGKKQKAKEYLRKHREFVDYEIEQARLIEDNQHILYALFDLAASLANYDNDYENEEKYRRKQHELLGVSFDL